MAFWGLVLEPKKSYTQRGVEQPFHISMAALDLQNCDPNEPSVTVVCRKRDSDFILCSLSKKQGIFNVPLNLDFELGGDINFHVLGNSTVHLTGYIIEDAEFDDDSSLDEEEEEDEDELSTGLLKNTKKLLEASTKQKSNNVGQNPAKKPKLEEIVADDDDDDDDEDDDDESDLDISANLEADSDDDEDDDDDDDDDDEDDEDGEAAEALKKLQAAQKKPKQQGKQNAQPAKADQNQGKQGKKDKKEALKGQNSTSPNKATNGAQSNGVPKRVIKGGVQVEDLVVGTGPVAKDGKQVNVYYAGRLKSNNKQFDACRSGSGFRFRLGKAEVIKGWDVGITGMKVGGKRRLTIPAAMGYGSAGAGKTIPPNSVLVFDVELKSVQ